MCDATTNSSFNTQNQSKDLDRSSTSMSSSLAQKSDMTSVINARKALLESAQKSDLFLINLTKREEQDRSKTTVQAIDAESPASNAIQNISDVETELQLTSELTSHSQPNSVVLENEKPGTEFTFQKFDNLSMDVTECGVAKSPEKHCHVAKSPIADLNEISGRDEPNIGPTENIELCPEPHIELEPKAGELEYLTLKISRTHWMVLRDFNELFSI